MIQLSAFLLALLAAHQLTPVVRSLMWRVNVVDNPNPANPGKIHRHPTPLGGGIAIFAATVGAMLVTGAIDAELGILLGAAAAMLALGFVDDTRVLDWKPRIFVQALASLVFILVTGASIPGIASIWVAVPLMVFWLVGVTNALNLMDNIDGATSGVAFMAGTLLFLIEPTSSAGILGLVVAGACCGFLRYNSRPASIFLGDTGTLFLGFTLGALALLQARHLDGSFAQLSVLPMIFGVPIFDTTLATFLRLRRHRPIYLPDKSNLTYRLQELGMTDREVVMFEYLLASLMGVCALATLRMTGPMAFLPPLAALSAMLAMGVRLGSVPYPEDLPLATRPRPAPPRSTRTAA
ncbi:MAG: hypothetical protein CME06_12430 [Gemmatimonadetes bacterium]|nr:hypothetical protein [Gemmatimonadota bacterium]